MTRPKTPIGEFDLIKRLCAGLSAGPRTILGPGDDCAILRTGKGPGLLTIDSLVENVHFKIPWTGASALGEKALTVNLSDIAAMGGMPIAAVVNLAVRPELDYRFFDGLYRGLRAAASRAGTEIAGGNVTRATALSITIAVLGEMRGPVMRRDQARVGDGIFVTGTLGDAAAGLRILEGRLDARGAARRFLIGRLQHPAARLDAGRRIAKLKPVPAAIDLSDGLLQDLGHILERSGVGAEVDLDAIPLSASYRAVIGDDPRLAISGGEDYELLFCTKIAMSDAELSRRIGLAVHRIGRIVRGDGSISLSGRFASSPRKLAALGWDQLRGHV